MTCREAEVLVTAYVDRELDVAASLQMEAHLAACSACSAAVERIAALRATLEAAPLRYAPSPELARRVRAAVRREAGPRRSWLRREWRWSAAPALAAAAVALLWITSTSPGGSADRQRLLDDLVSGHVRSLMVDHLVDVASTDQHTVRPWFNGKIDFAPPVADFTADGFPLVGGRVDYLAGRPVAALVYRHRQHVINVFIWPAGGVDPGTPGLAVQGYNVRRWNTSGLEYWAVSDLNPHDLGTLADLIQRLATSS